MTWAPGTGVVWSYEHDATPATVVRDDPDLLVVWIAPGTPRLTAVPTDGRALRDRPVPERFTTPQVWALGAWAGPGIVRVAVPGRAHSLWRFPGGWYANLEAPYERTADGVTSVDHTLDVWLDDSGEWRWKDEDELAATVDLGLRTAEEASAIRAEGESVIAAFARRDPPFSQRWDEWVPHPRWERPALPASIAARAGTPVT